MREPEGVETPRPGKSSERNLVKTLRTRRSQCRGRGFESLHLHQDQVRRLLCCERDELAGPRIARISLL